MSAPVVLSEGDTSNASVSKAPFLAIVNPAAGGGRCGRLAPEILERLRESGVELEIARTARAGEATEIARRAYGKSVRNFWPWAETARRMKS